MEEVPDGLQQEWLQQVHEQQQQQQPQQQPTLLGAKEVTGIIKQAQESKADPVTTVANIFNNLGQNVSVKGDTLRQAITKAELKLDEFSSTLLANADSISKSGNHVTITSTKDTPGKIQGYEINIRKIASFDVSISKGGATIGNIKGVEAKFGLWIDVTKVATIRQNDHTVLQIRGDKWPLHKTITTGPID
jgi:hypothetical protein